jgi:two-component system sensor histidine kinase MprB
VLAAAGIALAAFLGRLAGRGLVAPIREVADAAEHVGDTDDLGRRLVVRSDDEVGQLAQRFNAMLDRLETGRAELDASVRAQRQLVADASHELRTPITSLRTNVEVLLEEDRLDAGSRARLLDDVREQTEELGALVGDLIELARGDQPLDEPQDVRVDDLAQEAVARARRHAPGIAFVLDAEPVGMDGDPERLGRALNNLLDNAARHSPAGGTVEICVRPGAITVRDHGTGVDPRDLPHLFDRFFRGRSSRGRQGTGLGLAIVRQAAEAHGGTAEAANAEGGGARFTLRLPSRALEEEEAERSPDEGAAPERPTTEDVVPTAP